MPEPMGEDSSEARCWEAGMTQPARIITRHERTYVDRHYNTVTRPYWRVEETATGAAYTFTRRASAKSFWRVGCEHKMATTAQGWKYCVRCAGVLEQEPTP